MTLPSLIDALLQQEDINFLLTNRIPRRQLTRLMRWFSRIEQPFVRDLSIAVFSFFAGDLRLHEAKKTDFVSLHDCFIRELKDGVRPVADDSRVFVSPSDGIVIAAGQIDGAELLQAKGFTYTLDDLLGGGGTARPNVGGSYVTLRLKPNMYHRFHAPCDGRVERVVRIPGDRWNVNPAALKRVARLYCRNERAVVHVRAATGEPIAIVAVGAILVGSIRLRDVDACRKGEELGYFEHGSTIIVIGPPGVEVVEGTDIGATVRMGQPLMRTRSVRDTIANGHAVRHAAGASSPSIDS